MCGIIGQINLKESISKDRINELNYSLNMLKKRGPDVGGKFVKDNVYLGHRRLSILDLSNNANQPMVYKNLIIIFNGEIYNFKDIKSELEEKGHYFKTTSDTEVILHAYEEWEDKCIEKFDGMWAFAIYNKENKKLFLSRDRIGEKPLLYYLDDEKFIFCSEIPPLRKLINEVKYNWDALSNFCLYNFKHIPAPYTAYENVFKLEPGYNLLFDKGKIEKKKYFKLENHLKSKEEDFEKVLSKSIKQTKISDAPVGVFLSGGVDSSLICSYLKGEKMTAYTLGQNLADPEIKRAKSIAKKLNLKNKQTFIKNSNIYDNLINEIKKMIKYYGEPIKLFQILYSDMVLEMMQKDGIKVAIGGNGADEIFYGYDGQNKLKLISFVKRIYDYIRLKNIIITKKGLFRFLNTKNRELKIELYKEKIKKRTHIMPQYRKFMYESQFKEYSKEIPSKEMIDVFNWLGVRIENEHSITNVADISGARRGIEIRTPFLNKIMLNYAMNLKHKFKVRSFFNKKENKYVMKKLLRKRLGKKFAYFKKMGFGYNVRFENIIKRYKKDFDYYFTEVLPKVELYDINVIKKQYNNHLKGLENNEEILMEVLIVCIWFEKELN